MYTASYAADELKRWKVEGIVRADLIRRLAKLCMGWPYVWASQGEMCTPEWRRNRLPYCREKKYADMIRSDCPVLNGAQEQAIIPYSGGKISASSCAGCKWNGVRCFDCRGFIRWLLAQAGVPLYGESVTTQWETASNWAARGTIDVLPRGLVCCVFRPGHTGMYQGNGNIIHCSGTVKEEPLPGRPNWERWGVPAGLYSTDELRKAGLNVDEDKNMPTLRRGNQGDEVADLQMLLDSKYGFDLEIDGNFGKATETSVKEFQKKNGLTADGVVGVKTWKALGVKAEAPEPVPDDQPPTICIPYADWLEIKAAISAAYHVVKKYEGVE